MNNNINILVEAKNEYTNQLKKILSARLYEGFKSIYEDIIQISNQELEEKNIQSASVVKTFQKNLREIPLWNQETIKNECERIEKLSNCDYLESLIEAVFITNTKILTSVQINNKALDVKISIPSTHHFIHKCYMESAKEIYKNPYVFDQSKGLTPKEKHNNLREALSLIDLGINNSISNLLPIKDILKQGLTKMNKINDEEVSKKSSEVSITKDSENEDETNDDSEEGSEEETNENSSDEEDNSNDEDETNSDETSEEETKNNETHNENNNDEEKKDMETNSDIIKLDEVKEEVQVDEDSNKSPKISDVTIESKKDEKTKEELTTDKIKLISKYPVPLNHTSTQNGGHNNVDNKPIEDFKNIDLNRISTSFMPKIKSIEKVDSHNNIKEIKEVKEPEIKLEEKNDEHKLDTRTYILNRDTEKENKKFDIEKSPNPFLRKIKTSKFMKNKNVGVNKNSSFYKKKYEQNSAHYSSVTDNVKDTTLTETLQNTIHEIKDTQNSLKIIKNKIMLKEASSDEETDNEIQI